jgi:hypothetical protein
MADTKISALTALTGAGVDAANDDIPIEDQSATTTKKISVAELATAIIAAGAIATDSELSTHEADTTSVHGISDTANVLLKTLADALTTGDGKAYFRVPSTLNGCDIVAVAAHVTTVSSSGTPTVQIHNVTDTVDVLSTAITIDANEKDSSTAATPAVINGSNDSVATADELRIDVDVAGTGAKGLIVELQFRLP